MQIGYFQLFLITDAPEKIELSDDTLVLKEGFSSEKVLCSSEAYPEANYFWTFNDQVVSKDRMLYFDEEVTKGHAGEYHCIAHNRHGSKETKTRIEVMCKSKSHTQPSLLILQSW